MIDRDVAWDRVVAKAQAHRATYPRFDLEDFLAYVGSRGVSFICYAASRSTATINKGRRKRDSFARFAASCR